MIRRLLCVSLLSFIFLSSPSVAVSATQEGFDVWMQEFKKRAMSQGVSENTVSASLTGAKFLPKTIELDRKQPEGTVTFATYKDRILSTHRISKGRELLKKHRDKLEEVSAKYNVPPHYIVALWGIETNYGGYTGGFKTVDALATLAYEGRRAEFFETELVKALKIIDQGHISANEMKGSWAGALGQNQFMPSSFLAYAVDFNNDNRKDIWSDLEDVFASSANYLSSHGWKGDEKWGRKVQLPTNFDLSLINPDIQKTPEEWSRLGVLTQWGSALPVAQDMKGYIVTPNDDLSQAYLVYNNYDVFKKWNRSTYFAVAVGLLADQIGQAL